MTDENEQGETVRANQQSAELGRQLIKVLHVEDDPNCREAIADQLSDHGFVVHSFADALSLADGLAVFSEADIILLDWDLPGVSGIELLVALRECGVNLPVVFLTGYAFTAQENLAFESGAVDFIDKTRGVEILATRLRRLLNAPKSVAPPPASLVVCGKVVLNPNVSRAYWNDSDVGLSLVEYNIVHLLTSKAGRWVTLDIESGPLGDLSRDLRSGTLRRLHRRERGRRLSDKRSRNYQAHTQKVPRMR
jgi:DNA-binding response OmpR family regulator